MGAGTGTPETVTMIDMEESIVGNTEMIETGGGSMIPDMTGSTEGEEETEIGNVSMTEDHLLLVIPLTGTTETIETLTGDLLTLLSVVVPRNVVDMDTGMLYFLSLMISFSFIIIIATEHQSLAVADQGHPLNVLSVLEADLLQGMPILQFFAFFLFLYLLFLSLCMFIYTCSFSLETEHVPLLIGPGRMETKNFLSLSPLLERVVEHPLTLCKWALSLFVSPFHSIILL